MDNFAHKACRIDTASHRKSNDGLCFTFMLNTRSGRRTTPSGREANVPPPHKISAPIEARKRKIGG